MSINLPITPLGAWLRITLLRDREDGIQVMFYEHVTRGSHADENFTGIAICEEAFGGVEDAPTGNHVVLVGIVFDVGDTGRVFDGGVREEGCCVCFWRIVEVGGCGAEGVDFLWESSALG